MSLLLELHIIQAFAHNLLNRGKDNAPKTGHLGGIRRHEVSSQCWKRRISEVFREDGLLDESEMALRTKNLVDRIAEYVKAPDGTDPERVKGAVGRTLAAAKFKTLADKGHATEYLMFVPTRILAPLGALVTAHLDVLLPPLQVAAPPAETEAGTGDEPKSEPNGETATSKKGKAAKRQEKAAAKNDVPADVAKQAVEILMDASRTPQIALFGRMVADAKESGVEAACQVAFAVSTHAADIGFDFWTGLADDKKDAESGADMMGTAAFASGACFYRHLAVDIDELIKNLGGDAEAKAQAKHTLGAFVRAAITAIPTGKQNSTAAQNLPSLVLIDVRQGRQRSLNGAFDVPVRPTQTEHGGMVDKSVLLLAEHLAALDGMYGAKGRKSLLFSLLDPAKTLVPAFSERVPTALHCRAEGDGRPAIDVLIERAVSAAFAG